MIQKSNPNEDRCANTISPREACSAFREKLWEHAGKPVLLEAIHQNWGMIKTGDWRHTDWTVFFDGTYSKVSYRNLTGEEWEQRERDGTFSEIGGEARISHVQTASGRMSAADFSKLLDVLSADPWRSDGEDIGACDGSAWQFRQFDADGKMIRDSGRLGYIYGNAVLERIASLLP